MATMAAGVGGRGMRAWVGGVAMIVRIVPSEPGSPTDKLADAELVFDDGVLAGMKLVGFTIWRSRRRAVCSVTFPSRWFMVNGERRSYALLRPVEAGGSQENLRLLILQAYAEYERQGQPSSAAKEPEEPEEEGTGMMSADHG